MPGSTHDLSAARHHSILPTVATAELYRYADKGYVGGEGLTLLTPYQGRSLPDSARQANRDHAAVRANAERGFAVLKTWRIFDRFRGCPRQVGTFARAVLTLEQGLETVLRNTAIGYHRCTGEPNIARATRRTARHTSDLIRAVTSTGTTTQ